MSHRLYLDRAVLCPEELRRDPTRFQRALLGVQDLISENNFESAIEELLSQPILLELVLSAIGDSSHLSTLIIDHFPTSASSFIVSPAAKILSSVSLLLWSIDSRFPDEISHSIDHHRRSLELALPILQELTSILDPQLDVLSLRQRDRGDTSSNNAKHFVNFGVPVPSTLPDAEALSSEILQSQLVSLKFYLATLRIPCVAQAIKKAYTFQVPQTVNEVDPREERVDPESLHDPVPPTYPNVQPLRAALFFEGAKGFGDWRILISTNAESYLKKARRKNPKSLRIILKKIRELSEGHFSQDNQKRLSGADMGVPVYEAKLTRDLRLVYQVDCIPDYGSDVERQVLRIFGIYTHAQLRASLWDSMSYQLCRKGREYRRRCIFRNRPQPDGDSILPASFPCLTELKPDLIVPELPSEDLNDLHSLLVLHKFIPFSQAFWNSIIADQDVVHVFHLNPQEEEIVHHQQSCYVLGRSGTGKTITMAHKIFYMEMFWEWIDHDGLNKPRQLFVTKSRMLAKKVHEFYSSLRRSQVTASLSLQELVELAETQPNEQEDKGIFSYHDESEWCPDLPRQFSLLKDENFPLFITFNDLCAQLEADVVNALGSNKYSLPSPWRAATLISQARFLDLYWPHFPRELTKGLDPSQVFSEFMGVIRGSKEALATDERILDQETYEGLSVRCYWTFATQRNRIYRLFQAYVKQKRKYGDYDMADRTYRLLDAIQKSVIPGQKVDYLYVDEAQDNLLIDTFLLRSLCARPDGLFWAGDTAQTIAAGSSFRFNELKSFLFEIELRRRQRSDDLDIPKHVMVPPKTFQLTANYRSHGGIINCAHSVIELITTFWPESIDTLSAEKAIVDGLKPVFFSTQSQVNAFCQQFRDPSTSRIGFGAQQCILVRDDAARSKFIREMGKIGLILTLYEAKGLEFGDVLLYNFFNDSAADPSQWKIILKGLDVDVGRLAMQAPHFDQTRYTCICSELKFLYVAITRARQNMWIVDCSDKSEPMLRFWTAKNLIQVHPSGAAVPILAVSSSLEEWAAQGKMFFRHNRYSQAMYCFNQATLYDEAAIAEAFVLREDAAVIPAMDHYGIQRSKAFHTAAESFIKCINANMSTLDQRKCHKNAGNCFELAGNHIEEAAHAYTNAEEYSLLASLFLKAPRVIRALQVVRGHPGKVGSDVKEAVYDAGRVLYLEQHKLDEARELFDSDEEALTFMEEHDMDIQQAAFLEKIGRIMDAAELHFKKGRPVQAVGLFLQDMSNTPSVKRGSQCILKTLWGHINFGTKRESVQKDAIVAELLSYANQLKSESFGDSDFQEISMFRAIISGDFAQLQQLAQTFSATKKKFSALLCLDYIFDNPLHIKISSAHSVLDAFYRYAELLKDTSYTDPWINPLTQKLFGLPNPPTDNLLPIPANTFLGHSLALRAQHRSNFGTTMLTHRELLKVFKVALHDRLKRRVLNENNLCCKVVRGSCPSQGIFGRCDKKTCFLNHRIPRTTSSCSFNLHVRLCLRQILIVDTLNSVELVPELPGLRQYWVDQLYDALSPLYYLLGTSSNLDRKQVPEANSGFETVGKWIGAIFDDLDPPLGKPTISLTFLMKAIHLTFEVDDICQSWIRPPSPQWRYVCEVYEIQDMLECFSKTKPTNPIRGLSFLRHVMETNLHVEMGVLCDFVDHLCGSLVLTERCRSLHNVLLPRSWILRFERILKEALSCDSSHDGSEAIHEAQNLGKEDTIGSIHHNAEPAENQKSWGAGGKSIDSSKGLDLVETLGKLLASIHGYRALSVQVVHPPMVDTRSVDACNLLHRSTRLWLADPHIFSVFVARLCRALCLYSYNIGRSLYNNVMQVMEPLRAIDVLLPPGFHSRYVYAKHWDDILLVLQHSTAGSVMDEMIQLCDSDTASPSSKVAPGVRRVVFKDVPIDLGNSGLPAPLVAHGFGPFLRTAEEWCSVPDDGKDGNSHPRTGGALGGDTLEVK